MSHNSNPHPSSLHKFPQDPSNFPFRATKPPEIDFSSSPPLQKLQQNANPPRQLPENSKQTPTYALSSDLDSLKYRIYPEEPPLQQENPLNVENLRDSFENSEDMSYHPLRFSKEQDLETVHERSIESEMTYKTSIVKDSFKETDEFFPNSTRKSEQHGLSFKSFEAKSLASTRMEEPPRKFAEKPEKTEKIKVVDDLKQDPGSFEEIAIQLRKALQENEALRAEIAKFRGENQRLQEDFAQKVASFQSDNEKLKRNLMQLEESLFFRKQELKKMVEETRVFRMDKENLLKKVQILQNDLEEMDRVNQLLAKKNKEIDKDFQLHREETALLQEKRLGERLSELFLEKQYQFHNKEKKLRNENETLRQRNEELLQKLKEKQLETAVSNRKPEGNHGSLGSPPPWKRVCDELLGELDIKANNLEELRENLAEFKSFYKQMQKFTESVINMTVNCHPVNYFENNRPSLKQTWKWLKEVLEKYMVLKKSTLKSQDGLKIAMENEENNELIAKIMENLKVGKRAEILLKFYQIIHENNIFNRMLPKVRRLLNVDKRASVKEVEKKIDEIV